MELTLRPTGRGWLTADVSDGDQHYRLVVSRLSDAVLGLVSAAVRVVGGAPEEDVGWAEEPGGHRWVLRAADGELQVRLLHFDEDLFGDQDPETAGEVRFETRLSRQEFGRSVHRAVAGLLGEAGPEAFRRTWGHPPPSAQLEELDAVLR